MSVCTLPPGGVRPGASRWSAARAEAGPLRWSSSTARTAEAAAAISTASAYQQRARETGDPAYYRLSELALQRATTAHGPLALIVQGEASLANTRHRFALGLRLARRAVGLDHYNGSAYAALGDALFNLGRYRAAF